MAPTLEIRQTCLYRNAFGQCTQYSGYYGSNWSNWGRWVLLGCVIVAALLVFFLCSCFGARKRRKQGAQPMYGTGWLAPQPPQGHGQMNYYGPNGSNAQPQFESNNPQYGQQAPPYSSGAANTYYGQNQGYEMQAPPNTYNPSGGSNVYAPPAGPPPNKY